MKEIIAALYALQQQDTALDALKKQFASLDSGKTEKKAFDEATQAIKELEAALHAARAAVTDTELEQKTIEEKRAGYETKLYGGKVNNPKELQSLQDEVDMLARNRDRLGEKLKSLQTELEESRDLEKGAKQTLAAAKSALQEKLAAYKEDSERIVAQAKAIFSQRTEAAKAISPPLLKRYEALRANQNGIAVVPVEDTNSCGGCKMGLSSSVVRRVFACNDIEACENCGRILISIKQVAPVK